MKTYDDCQKTGKMNAITTNKQPIPRFEVYGFQGGRFFRNRYQWVFAIRFPCLPPKWYSIDSEMHHKLKILFAGFGIKTESKKYPDSLNYGLAKSNEILMCLFGLKTLQAFYRHLIKKQMVACVKPRSLWCVPQSDLKDCLTGRYRANSWNESCNVPKEYRWLFDKLKNQFLKSNYDWEFRPDYSVFDIGPERKPILYVCNICNRSGVKEDWRWGRPGAFSVRDQILYCPECKTENKSDFDKAFDDITGNEFRPFSKWQDDYWFTF